MYYMRLYHQQVMMTDKSHVHTMYILSLWVTGIDKVRKIWTQYNVFKCSTCEIYILHFSNSVTLQLVDEHALHSMYCR